MPPAESHPGGGSLLRGHHVLSRHFPDSKKVDASGQRAWHP
jgi:hypothetical protein